MINTTKIKAFIAPFLTLVTDSSMAFFINRKPRSSLGGTALAERTP
jgi:hypothetical protein